MLTFASSTLAIVWCTIAYAIPSLKSPNNVKKLNYYQPAEADYPPIEPFDKSIRLPESSRFDEERPTENSVLPLASTTLKDERAKTQHSNIERPQVMVSSAIHPENFMVQQNDDVRSSSISNPASYYLGGANFQQIDKPPCRLLGCDGPYPNDGSLRVQIRPGGNHSEQCEQKFIELNGCTSNHGYPIGMVCTLCCQCTDEFIAIMRKTRGFMLSDFHRHLRV